MLGRILYFADNLFIVLPLSVWWIKLLWKYPYSCSCHEL